MREITSAIRRSRASGAGKVCTWCGCRPARYVFKPQHTHAAGDVVVPDRRNPAGRGWVIPADAKEAQSCRRRGPKYTIRTG